MELFECIPPSLGSYYALKVCTDGTSISLREVNKMINCLKPCKMFKMQVANGRKDNLDSERGSRLSVSFKELITISQDQYSYTWLNFIAEVGGYVGLFLGYSAIDLTDVLIQKISGFFRFQVAHKGQVLIEHA